MAVTFAEPYPVVPAASAVFAPLNTVWIPPRLRRPLAGVRRIVNISPINDMAAQMMKAI